MDNALYRVVESDADDFARSRRLRSGSRPDGALPAEPGDASHRSGADGAALHFVRSNRWPPAWRAARWSCENAVYGPGAVRAVPIGSGDARAPWCRQVGVSVRCHQRISGRHAIWVAVGNRSKRASFNFRFRPFEGNFFATRAFWQWLDAAGCHPDGWVGGRLRGAGFLRPRR